MTGKTKAVAYNKESGDACFRSLLTPHSARTTVRAVPYIDGQATIASLWLHKISPNVDAS